MSNDVNQIRFHQLLEIQINNIIKSKFTGSALTPLVMREIREAIKTQLVDVFSKSKFGLSPGALIWLCDQYFKAIKINDTQMMSDTVVINEYKLSELEFNDIKLMRNLFLETRLGSELDKEFQRRSQS